MAIVETLLSPYTLILIPVLFYLLPFLRNKTLITVPGPLAARLSNVWLMWQSRRGKRFLAVHEAHQKYGPVVRIQPNHVSIADDAAIQTIYGHGNGFNKAEYYDAFVSIQRGLFNTRDRNEHTRKRKIVSHTFSAKSIGQFEQYIHANLEMFYKQWTRLSELQRNPRSGYASIDALHWFNYLAFDIIGDLAFGAPFGMLEQGKDVAEARSSPDAPPTYVAAVEVLNRRGELSNTIGSFPEMKPYARYFPDPFFYKGVKAVEDLAGIARARVRQRLENPSDRTDLLARLMQGKDAKGEPMGRDELTAEALTQLIAGSDTTSNSSCALLYWVVRTPGVIGKLQKELDAALPEPGVPSYEQMKDLEYVSFVINETLRIHSTSSLGLPRLIPGVSPENPNPQPVELHGYSFPPGTALSVPAYTIHHSKDIWGVDADQFVPERWQENRLTERQKDAFIPFSYGPRACVGRNVAEMELRCIVGTVFKNFEFLDEHEGEMQTSEGFLRKPLGFDVGIRRRS